MAAAAAAPAPAPAQKPPPWSKKSGAARVASEMRSLQKSVASGVLPGIRKVENVEDDALVWRLEVIEFDEEPGKHDDPGGQLNKDLAALGSKWGPMFAAVVLELRFPPDYPSSPFFLRVVRPRMAMYSGHVTAGSSVCIEALTQSGGPGAWCSDMCAESVLVTALANMLHAERVYVQTATAGGRAGPLRIDTKDYKSRRPQEYSLAEAQAAFKRTLANHGWDDGRARQAAPRAQAFHAMPGGAAAGFRAAPAAAAAAAAAAAPRWAPPPPAAAALARPQRPVVPVRTQQVRPAQRAAPAPAAAPAAGAAPRKRGVEDVIDLLSDSEDEGPSFSSRPLAKQPRLRGSGGAAVAAAGAQRHRLSSQETMDLTIPAAAAGAAAAGRSAAAGPPQRPLQLSLSERLDAANARHGLDLVMPPAHWEVTDALLQGKLVLVDLPLPGAARPHDQHNELAIAELQLNGFSRAEAVSALEANGGDAEASLAWLLERQLAAEGQQDQVAVAELTAYGLSKADAEAALKECSGDVDQALAWAVECSEVGGAAAVARLTGGSSGSRGGATAPAQGAATREQEARRREREAGRREQEAQQSALVEESTRVLRLFASNAGVAHDRVRGIQRVQNLQLYSDYTRRRARIRLETSPVGAPLNERQLFHGADKDTLWRIVDEGFDHRVTNLSGALGAANYFSCSASYSDGFSRTAKHSAPERQRRGSQFSLQANGFRSAHGMQLAPGSPVLASRCQRPKFEPDGVAMLLCDAFPSHIIHYV